MARRVFTKLRRFTQVGQEAGALATFLRSSSTIVLALLGVVLTLALLVLPPAWAYFLLQEHGRPWSDQHWVTLDRLEREWQTLPVPPPFTSGEEPAVKAYLAANPLLVALRDQQTHAIWIREEDHLRPGAGHPLGERFGVWFRMAEQSPTFQWFPPKALDPDHGHHPVTVLSTDRWMAVKQWRVGSAQAEDYLRRLLPPENLVRVGLKPDPLPTGLKPEAWGAWPHLQLDPYRTDNTPFVSLNVRTNAYGEGWSIVLVPTPVVNAGFNAYFRRQLTLYYGVAILVALGLVYGIWIRARARRRSALESDRLASLAHSLKTPLAILKFRCDSLRLGRLGPDQADEQLLRLGAEVDHLTLVIDNGLRAIKGDESAGPASEADPAFFQGVAADLEPAFEAEERRLELHLCEASGEASLPALRSAVATLLENGLAHGAGTVTLETRRLRRAFLISVRDEGSGLSPEELEALGRPFQRFRSGEAEGFKREGLGLGLSLLIQMAEREGWGLQFSSEPSGLTVDLRIRPHAGRGLRDWIHPRRPIAMPLESK